MIPEHLALIAEARSILLKALSQSELYRKNHLSVCLQLAQAANHALSLTIKLERGSASEQVDYAQLLEHQMVSVRACQATLTKLSQGVTQ
ncbi:hypothetical protein [Pseudomonas graminis]